LGSRRKKKNNTNIEGISNAIPKKDDYDSRKKKALPRKNHNLKNGVLSSWGKPADRQDRLSKGGAGQGGKSEGGKIIEKANTKNSGRTATWQKHFSVKKFEGRCTRKAGGADVNGRLTLQTH